MARFYVTRWGNPRQGTKGEFSLDNDLENALLWDTREKAARFCVALNEANIEVPLVNGGTHLCNNFQVEELPPHRVLVRCQVPSPIKASDTVTRGQNKIV